MREAAARLASGLKPCSKCAETKPLDDFNADPRAQDGRRSECKGCERAAKRRSYHATGGELPRQRP